MAHSKCGFVFALILVSALPINIGASTCPNSQGPSSMQDDVDEASLLQLDKSKTQQSEDSSLARAQPPAVATPPQAKATPKSANADEAHVLREEPKQSASFGTAPASLQRPSLVELESSRGIEVMPKPAVVRETGETGEESMFFRRTPPGFHRRKVTQVETALGIEIVPEPGQ
mmetsp:Transcript_136244/g.236900  ORF Transcript_136244/g.236900 Transcript_136244/m.236900 type:complete len:173 (-) Transcript_136244:90-608(-)